jgi:predicted  nucleic acid-binding Zn-ribbon protein
MGAGFYASTAVTEEALANLEERVERNEAAAEPNRFRLREIERAQTRIETTVEERTEAIARQLDRILDKLDQMSTPQ